MTVSALLLCAGFGSRLMPLTSRWPKCLMPIQGRPLLEYWLSSLADAGVSRVLVNGHHCGDIVRSFLQISPLNEIVEFVFETDLLGTAATLRQNADFFGDDRVLLAHADNLLGVAMRPFVEFHSHDRPSATDLTMMTFDTNSPEQCGIVLFDQRRVVQQFFEKVTHPPGRCANGAVYLLEPQVTDWVCRRPAVTDFSTQVLPEFLGRIATFHHAETHRDIGTWAALAAAQSDPVMRPDVVVLERWEFFGDFMEIALEIEKRTQVERIS